MTRTSGRQHILPIRSNSGLVQQSPETLAALAESCGMAIFDAPRGSVPLFHPKPILVFVTQRWAHVADSVGSKEDDMVFYTDSRFCVSSLDT